MHEQAKVLRKKKYRQLSADKKRKLLRFSRLEILHGRQSKQAVFAKDACADQSGGRNESLARDAYLAC